MVVLVVACGCGDGKLPGAPNGQEPVLGFGSSLGVPVPVTGSEYRTEAGRLTKYGFHV